MIVSKTPFRITLGGGGTDLPFFYRENGGMVCSVAIDKFMYIMLGQPFADDLIRLKYSEYEVVDSIDKIKHDIARESLNLMGVLNKIDVVSLADLPAGTGLGSSGCYTVGLLNALGMLTNNIYYDTWALAEDACAIEMYILNRPSGKQDPYMAAYGGLRKLDIDIGGNVGVSTPSVKEQVLSDLNNNMLMFYTGVQRNSDIILSSQRDLHNSHMTYGKDRMHGFYIIKEIGYKIVEALESGNITDIGILFNEHWELKKTTSTKMSNKKFDEIYSFAIKNGALGGKISGAGGGGFFLFYVESNHQKFINEMSQIGLKHMMYNFEPLGSILYEV